MLTIALTTIPPRFSSLAPTLRSLLAQDVPARVVLSVPNHYRRFPGRHGLPDLPDGVTLNLCGTDFGPATKLLGVIDLPDVETLIVCDDDCVYAPGWAQALLSARADGNAVSGAPFPVGRLKRHARSGLDQIAQGFSGLLVTPSMFDDDVRDLPDAAYAADDIWISGQLARHGIPILAAPAARKACTPRQDSPAPLQTSTVAGLTRAEANTACLDALTARYGIWPRNRN